MFFLHAFADAPTTLRFRERGIRFLKIFKTCLLFSGGLGLSGAGEVFAERDFWHNRQSIAVRTCWQVGFPANSGSSLPNLPRVKRRKRTDYVPFLGVDLAPNMLRPAQNPHVNPRLEAARGRLGIDLAGGGNRKVQRVSSPLAWT
jgi:hypothetical protein